MSEKLGHMTFEQERKPLFLDIAPARARRNTARRQPGRSITR
jgi:hypothetical protein